MYGGTSQRVSSGPRTAPDPLGDIIKPTVQYNKLNCPSSLLKTPPLHSEYSYFHLYETHPLPIRQNDFHRCRPLPE